MTSQSRKATGTLGLSRSFERPDNNAPFSSVNCSRSPSSPPEAVESAATDPVRVSCAVDHEALEATESPLQGLLTSAIANVPGSSSLAALPAGRDQTFICGGLATDTPHTGPMQPHKDVYASMRFAADIKMVMTHALAADAEAQKQTGGSMRERLRLLAYTSSFLPLAQLPGGAARRLRFLN